MNWCWTPRSPPPEDTRVGRGGLSLLQHLAAEQVLCLNLQENNRAGYNPTNGATLLSLPPATRRAELPSAGSQLRLCNLFLEGSACNSDSPRINRGFRKQGVATEK